MFGFRPRCPRARSRWSQPWPVRRSSQHDDAAALRPGLRAADNARFALPFAQLGLCPEEAASSLLLPMIVGHQRAAEDCCSANRSLPTGTRDGPGEPDPAGDRDDRPALAQAAKLARLPASSLRATKRLMKEGSVRPSFSECATRAPSSRDADRAGGAQAFSAFLRSAGRIRRSAEPFAVRRVPRCHRRRCRRAGRIDGSSFIAD